MNTKKQIGIILIAVAIAAGVWVYTRMTSLLGQMHSWSPPFDEFEIYTIVGGLIALFALIVGARFMSTKPAEPPKTS